MVRMKQKIFSWLIVIAFLGGKIMPVSIKTDSPNCECGTAWVFRNDRYECPKCGAFKDKNIILTVRYDESKNK